MILPSKHLPQDRALLTVGGHVLTFLARPKTVSALWEELNQQDEGGGARVLAGSPTTGSCWRWTCCTPLEPSNLKTAWLHGGQLDL